MKFLQIFLVLLLLSFGVVFAVPPINPLDFGDGLLFVGNDVPEDHFVINEDFTFMFKTFQKSNGIVVDNQTCTYRLVQNFPLTPIILSENVTFLSDGTGVILVNGTEYLNETGDYTFGIICYAEIPQGTTPVETYVSEGGYLQIHFIIGEHTLSNILWEEPTDWTFPVIYILLSILVIGLGLAYSSSIIGVLGSVMLLFSYFLVGATSPLLFAPLIIISLLLAFKFATL